MNHVEMMAKVLTDVASDNKYIAESTITAVNIAEELLVSSTGRAGVFTYNRKQHALSKGPIKTKWMRAGRTWCYEQMVGVTDQDSPINSFNAKISAVTSDGGCGLTLKSYRNPMDSWCLMPHVFAFVGDLAIMRDGEIRMSKIHDPVLEKRIADFDTIAKLCGYNVEEIIEETKQG